MSVRSESEIRFDDVRTKMRSRWYRWASIPADPTWLGVSRPGLGTVRARREARPQPLSDLMARSRWVSVQPQSPSEAFGRCSVPRSGVRLEARSLRTASSPVTIFYCRRPESVRWCRARPMPPSFHELDWLLSHSRKVAEPIFAARMFTAKPSATPGGALDAVR